MHQDAMVPDATASFTEDARVGGDGPISSSTSNGSACLVRANIYCRCIASKDDTMHLHKKANRYRANKVNSYSFLPLRTAVGGKIVDYAADDVSPCFVAQLLGRWRSEAKMPLYTGNQVGLQTQAAKCDCGAQLKDQLRDRLIAGIQLPELQQNLLLCPDQKFQTIRKMCEQCEDVKHVTKTEGAVLLNYSERNNSRMQMNNNFKPRTNSRASYPSIRHFTDHVNIRGITGHSVSLVGGCTIPVGLSQGTSIDCNFLVSTSEPSIIGLKVLRKAAKCDCGAQLKDQLRDRLIAGIQLPELQQNLLLCPDQKFQTIRKMCEQCEDVKHIVTPIRWFKNLGNVNLVDETIPDIHALTGKRIVSSVVKLDTFNLSRRIIPFDLREPVRQALNSVCAKVILTPVESSDWATPIVTPLKAENLWARICGEYRLTLNTRLLQCACTTEEPEGVLYRLSDSKIDLKTVHLRIPLDEASSNLTVIITPFGYFRYSFLRFGLNTLPAVFQQVMNTVAKDLEGGETYQDDVKVHAADKATHDMRLLSLLKRFSEFDVAIHPDKCTFGVPSFSCLVYIVDGGGYKPVKKPSISFSKCAITNQSIRTAFSSRSASVLVSCYS
ncbi:hypothetical protein CLF_111525 [Clonorchis sinensis]|uniref:Reverse transcriptase domain-containing protein n=1 Tax=Clonorchis sinensis TaxID=79923 RepID=G7YLQ4_CLOSI|nr:hypothetical protein CLF_111525 [Clonorchis sinensis]